MINVTGAIKPWRRPIKKPSDSPALMQGSIASGDAHPVVSSNAATIASVKIFIVLCLIQTNNADYK